MNLEQAVEALRGILAEHSGVGGEPCDGCLARMVHNVLRQYDGNGEILDHYSAALDEIFVLKSALAHEARVIEAHLGLKTFPKSRRAFAEAQIVRMRAAAKGRAHTAYREAPSRLDSLRKLGVDTLTRAQWEARDANA